MRRPFPLLLALLTALGVTASTLSAASAGPGNAPWVTASSTSSITLDWPGGSSGWRTFYATSYGGVLKGSAKSKTSTKSTVKITGLSAGQMYCFQTARSSGANRSQRYCHSTMRFANKKSQTRVGVATFNVCAVANGCGSWRKREDTVVKRIREAKVDVVTIQEGHSVIDRIAGRIANEFTVASESGTEAVFYRTRKLSVAQTCTPVTPPAESATWDTSTSTHLDEDGNTWTYENGGWVRGECEDLVGAFHLRGNATAAWARLAVRSTGRTYVFVSAHLTSGKSSGAARNRDTETRRLVSKAKGVADGRPIVFAGDFNSHRNRPNDSPRKRFERAGYTDAYDRSARYENAYINSYNGYEKRPVRGVKYGDHVDHVFLPNRSGADNWAVVAPTRGGKNVRLIASDHNLVRVTALLP